MQESHHSELGDIISSALEQVGITKERVSNWLGRDCGCAARQAKLNRLSRWAARALSGSEGGSLDTLIYILGYRTRTNRSSSCGSCK